MLSPKTLKTYFNGYKQRVQGITHVFCLVTEAEIQKRIKSIPIGSIVLIIIVPSSETDSPDVDNIDENSPILTMLVKRIDRKDDTEDGYLDTLHDMAIMLQEVRSCMLYDKQYCSSIMRHLMCSNIHTDPEVDFYGCFGYSMSFTLQDQNFLADPTFVVPQDNHIYVYYGPMGPQGPPGAPYIRKHYWNNPYSYNGRAPIGSNEDDDVWIVERLTISAYGSVTSTDTLTDVKWIDILTLNF